MDSKTIQAMFASHGRQMETIYALLSSHDCKRSEEHGCSCEKLVEEAEAILEQEEESDEVCPFCGGSGETEFTTYENGVPSGIGTQKCICKIEENDDYDPDADY